MGKLWFPGIINFKMHSLQFLNSSHDFNFRRSFGTLYIASYVFPKFSTIYTKSIFFGHIETAFQFSFCHKRSGFLNIFQGNLFQTMFDNF
jgi:hypothetical protein